MEMKQKPGKIGSSHRKMMLICCGIPLILLVVGVYLLGWNDRYLFWWILLLCPLMHFIMMKDMHKKEVKENDKASYF
ncbi:DUF2933 domain-containing protein [Candidatus Woesearchaeota archaeon]|nr:DUF2933 domain-containing protein [Candidatus Woesearchaeota archaeon]